MRKWRRQDEEVGGDRMRKWGERRKRERWKEEIGGIAERRQTKREKSSTMAFQITTNSQGSLEKYLPRFDWNRFLISMLSHWRRRDF